jgi:hypothetical protein
MSYQLSFATLAQYDPGQPSITWDGAASSNKSRLDSSITKDNST